MTHNRRRIRQRQLFEPDGPSHILEGDGKTELLTLLTQLIREAVTNPTQREGGGHEQDHG